MSSSGLTLSPIKSVPQSSCTLSSLGDGLPERNKTGLKITETSRIFVCLSKETCPQCLGCIFQGLCVDFYSFESLPSRSVVSRDHSHADV